MDDWLTETFIISFNTSVFFIFVYYHFFWCFYFRALKRTITAYFLGYIEAKTSFGTRLALQRFPACPQPEVCVPDQVIQDMTSTIMISQPEDSNEPHADANCVIRRTRKTKPVILSLRRLVFRVHRQLLTAHEVDRNINLRDLQQQPGLCGTWATKAIRQRGKSERWWFLSLAALARQMDILHATLFHGSTFFPITTMHFIARRPSG